MRKINCKSMQCSQIRALLANGSGVFPSFALSDTALPSAQEVREQKYSKQL